MIVDYQPRVYTTGSLYYWHRRSNRSCAARAEKLRKGASCQSDFCAIFRSDEKKSRNFEPAHNPHYSTLPATGPSPRPRPRRPWRPWRRPRGSPAATVAQPPKLALSSSTHDQTTPQRNTPPLRPSWLVSPRHSPPRRSLPSPPAGHALVSRNVRHFCPEPVLASGRSEDVVGQWRKQNGVHSPPRCSPVSTAGPLQNQKYTHTPTAHTNTHTDSTCALASSACAGVPQGQAAQVNKCNV